LYEHIAQRFLSLCRRCFQLIWVAVALCHDEGVLCTVAKLPVWRKALLYGPLSVFLNAGSGVAKRHTSKYCDFENERLQQDYEHGSPLFRDDQVVNGVIWYTDTNTIPIFLAGAHKSSFLTTEARCASAARRIG
jgi:hypothetical protein